MDMIEFGPWRPDTAGTGRAISSNVHNVLPTAAGFRPLPEMVSFTDAVPTDISGGATVIDVNGGGVTLAGTSTKLYKLSGTAWVDITRSSGDYSVAPDNKWRFGVFGDLALSVDISEPIQKYSIVSGGLCSALGGSPPNAHYITTVGDFVVLGNLSTGANKVHWSGLNNAEFWTEGSQSSDSQEFPDGGAVKGITGGGVGYIFQSTMIRQMIFQPGSPLVFDFRPFEMGRGLLAPDSLVQVGTKIFFLAADGFFELQASGSVPIGVGKVNDFFFKDARADNITKVDSTVDPISRRVFWSYVSKDNSGIIPDRVIVYDWGLQEWTKGDISAREMLKFVSPGYTLEQLDAFGGLDSLPFGLDSSAWTGGGSVMGAFGSDNKLTSSGGVSQTATIETCDFRPDSHQRSHITWLAPVIDVTAMTARVGGRERPGDGLAWGADNSMETSGHIFSHSNHRYMRVRLNIAAGAVWTLAQGFYLKARVSGER